jgi:hypothetical protein
VTHTAMHRYRISEGIREYYKRKNGGESMRTCDVPGCGREHHARGYCSSHHQRWRRGEHGHRLTRPIGVHRGYTEEPSVIPVGWLPTDAGQPMPYSDTLKVRLILLELDDKFRDKYSESRYDMTCDDEGIWTIRLKAA